MPFNPENNVIRSPRIMPHIMHLNLLSMNAHLLHCNMFLVSSDDSVFSQGGAEIKDHRSMEEDNNGDLVNYRVGWKLFSLVEKVKRGQKLLLD